MRYSEKWGDSVEAAVNLALQTLNLTKDQVKVTILEEPSKGFFGIGSKLAKVRVEELDVKEVKQAKENKTENKPVQNKNKNKEKIKIGLVDPEQEKILAQKAALAEAQLNEERAANPNSDRKHSKNRHQKHGKNNRQNREVSASDENKDVKIEIKNPCVSEKPLDLTPVDEHPAKEFLEKTFKEMGIEVSVSVSSNKDDVYVDIEGKDTGTVIGKRGATLDAIQYLTSLVVNKSEEAHTRVIVDAEGYRAKREATLSALAVRLAEKVLKTGRPARLEPMNPYERKVIHSTLQGVEGIYTRSEGDEPYRRVVIALKK